MVYQRFSNNSTNNHHLCHEVSFAVNGTISTVMHSLLSRRSSQSLRCTFASAIEFYTNYERLHACLHTNTHTITMIRPLLLQFSVFFLIYFFFARFSRCLLASTAHTLACFERSALSFTLEFCSCSNFINLIFIINDEYDRRVRQTGTPLEIVIPTP